MKVLFIKSTINAELARNDFGLGSLSAILKAHKHNAGLFVVWKWDDVSMLELRIKMAKPDILAFSTYSSSFQSTVKISNAMRKKFPDLLQIMGGVHLILNPDDICLAPSVDAVCVGEGEYALLEFIRNYARGDGSHLYTKGFWTRKKKLIIKNPSIPFVKDVEKLPFPDREIFLQESMLFRDNHGDRTLYLDFMFTRGCPFPCTYCSNHALRKVYGTQKYVRRMSPKHAIEWIQHDLARYPCDKIAFIDDTFTLDPIWTNEFINLYEKIHIPFACFLRVGTFTKETLVKLKKIGCFKVSVGVESGDETFRTKVLKRSMTNEDLIRAFSWAEDLGIKTQAFVMVGLPNETRDMWLKTVTFLGRLRPSELTLSVFYPYPGTELYDLSKKNGYLRHKQAWDFIESKRSILSMPQFSGTDIAYYRDNVYKMVDQATPAANFLSQLHKNLKLSLLSIPPSSSQFGLMQKLNAIDEKIVQLVRKLK